MPRPKSFDVEILRDVLLDHKSLLFDIEKKKYKGPRHECWTEIADVMGGVIKPKHIYTIVTENRYGIADKFGFQSNVDPESEEDIGEPVSGYECNSHSGDGFESNKDFNVFNEDVPERESSRRHSLDNDDIMNFDLSLPVSVWRGLFCTREYKDNIRVTRNYNVLKPFDWTNIIYDSFFEKTRLNCCLSFERSKVTPFGTKWFLKFTGHCSDCDSRLTGITDQEPANDSPLVINCEYVGNFNFCGSNKKRRLIGMKRIEYSEKMLKENKSPAYIRREEASKKMDYGDPEPSSIPTGNTLRVLKHKSNLDTVLDHDPLPSVLKMKLNPPYNCILHDVGAEPFFLHYWTSTEINAYRMYARRNKNCTISIDATGGIIKQLIVNGKKSSHIFLYEITVHDAIKGLQFSAAHMLSARHNNNAISFWLSEWSRENDVPAPRTVVIDNSMALIMACVRVFTQYSSVPMYVQVCSELLTKTRPKTDVPHCYIRLDFNHIMHSVASWNELHGKPKRFRNFYLRSLGLVISSTDFDDVKKLLEHIFYASLHEEDGYNKDGDPTACQRAKLALKARIAGHHKRRRSTDEAGYEGDSNSGDDEDILDYDDCNEHLDEVNDGQEEIYNALSCGPQLSFFDDITNIFQRCEREQKHSCNRGPGDNMQYCPSLAARILKFSKLLPLWSGVMVPIFGYGSLTESSAPSESRFNDLKNRVFRHKSLPVRLDTFIETHVTSIIGEMNLTKAKYDQNDADVGVKSDVSPMTKATSREQNPVLANVITGMNVTNTKLDKDDDDDDDDTFTETAVENRRGLADDGREKPLKNVTKLGDDDTFTKTAVENWRGLADDERGKPLKKRKQTYLDCDPTIQFVKENYSKATVIGLLKNGSDSHLQAVTIENESYSLQYTCAFDSIFQIVYVASADSLDFNFFVTHHPSQQFFSMIASAVKDGITAQTYRKRAQLLLNMYPAENLKFNGATRLHTLNCVTTVQWIVRGLFNDFPSLCHEIECLSCNSTTTKTLHIMVASFPTPMTNVKNLQQLLCAEIERSTRRCGQCGSDNVHRRDSWGENLWIECCYRELDLQVKLQDIPVVIKMNDELDIYHLRGAIQFIPPVGKTALGHYMALAWRTQAQVWERYDDFASKQTAARKNGIIQAQLLFYTK